MAFHIYEGESAMRTKAARLEQENRRLKAENDRLRAKCGEAVTAEVVAELASARLGEQQAFTSGDCQVVIGGPPANGTKPPAMNPLIARARAKQPQAKGTPAPLAPVDLPASTQQATEEVDEELASARFSLLEPHGR
jgi:hypothetical protein